MVLVDTVDVVAVPPGTVPLVPGEPLPDALPVALVSLLIGGPPPVSVAVVPDVELGVLWIVSVDPSVDSAGLRLHAATINRRAVMTNVFLMTSWCAM